MGNGSRSDIATIAESAFVTFVFFMAGMAVGRLLFA